MKLRAVAASGFRRALLRVGGCVVRASSLRRRGVRIVIGALGLTLFFTASAASISRPPDPIFTDKGTLVWYPKDVQGGERIFGITRLRTGGYDVGYNPRNLYQNATLRGSMVDGRAIEIQYLEINVKPRASAKLLLPGVRNDARLRRYPVLEWYAEVGEDSVEVWSNGNGGFVVIVTAKKARSIE